MSRYIKSFANDAAIQAAVDDKSLGKPYVALNESAGTIDWNTKEETDYSRMYFTFEPLSDGMYMFRNWNSSTKSYSYSINNSEWVIVTGLTAWLTLSVGDTVRLKSTDGPDGLFDAISLNFNAYGNILSLKYGDNFIGIKNDDYKLSFNGSKIVDASNLILPATALTNGYKNMFMNCRSLTKAPKLPAINLVNSCYNDMFLNCINLTEAPELPAAITELYSYSDMFSECANLNYIKCLATTFSSCPSCDFENWLSGVSPTGTFVKKAGIVFPSGAIPSGWTVIEE